MRSVLLPLYVYGHICILVYNMLKLSELNLGWFFVCLLDFFGMGGLVLWFCLFQSLQIMC